MINLFDNVLIDQMIEWQELRGEKWSENIILIFEWKYLFLKC